MDSSAIRIFKKSISQLCVSPVSVCYFDHVCVTKILMQICQIGAAYIVLNPDYAKPTHRGARTIVFIGLGLCAIVPVSQLFLTHGFRTLISEMGINWLLISGALYIGGALL